MTQPAISILHYASPPGVGGVESLIGHQARALHRLSYPVRVLSGEGAAFDASIPTHIDPRFHSTHPQVLARKQELDAGQVTPAFESLVEQMTEALRQALGESTVCIAHNLLTLHKNLALTAALRRVRDLRLIAYCHDLAWTNTQYRAELHAGYPWDLLRQPWPGVRYVTISQARQAEMAVLLGIPPQDIPVITPGIDPASFFRWGAETTHLAEHFRWLEADGLLLLPARLTRRKNIEFALHVLAALRQHSERDFRLIVTGPPGPHNPDNAHYLRELLTLRESLGLDSVAHFCALTQTDAVQVLSDDTVSDLYRLADTLFFPSTQEGFGIPILEAGLSGTPIFCSDLAPLRQTGQTEIYTFDPRNAQAESVAESIWATLHESRTYRLRLRVRQQYRWETLVRDQLVPLLG
jgi:glycosyltransferase involved in cell wall biosynthesis